MSRGKPIPAGRRVLWSTLAASLLALSLFAWNCTDYTVPADSPTITMVGSVPDEIELVPEVMLEHAEPPGRFCPRYHFTAHVDNPGTVRVENGRYRAKLRVGTPRLGIFCNWKLFSVRLMAHAPGKSWSPVFSYWSSEDRALPEPLERVRCWIDEYSVECETLYLPPRTAIQSTHRLDIVLDREGEPPNPLDR